MSHFPERLSLPNDVYESRTQRQKELISSARQGIAIRLAIIMFEFFGVWLFGSAALLMDGLASLVDVFSSLCLIICIKLADRPPDRNHPFGHGRYEPLVGLLLGAFLFVVGGGTLIQHLFTLNHHEANTALDARAWIFPVIAVLLLEICYRIVIRAAERQHSPALAADAIHYRIDALTSLFAAIALVASALFPEQSSLFDHGGAILISCLMMGLGAFASKQNLQQLLDHIPEQRFFDMVKSTAASVQGVQGTEKIGIQLFGPDALVNIDIEVDPVLTVDKAHQISQHVRYEIQKAWPAVRDVIVHIEPYYPNDH
jgi:cation diffusion facilitator family transporter